MTATERESGAGWLAALRLYRGLILAGNLVGEFVQMPLYTLWLTDTAAEIAFAGVHCKAGDLLIALAALTAALVFFGRTDWPSHGFWPSCVGCRSDRARLHSLQRMAKRGGPAGLGLPTRDAGAPSLGDRPRTAGAEDCGA